MQHLDVGSASSAVLTAGEMKLADRLAIDAGTRGIALMERAGAFAAGVARRLRPVPGRVALLAGAGNNGGDAYVAARHLAAEGWLAEVFSLRMPAELSDDAAEAAAGWTGTLRPLAEFAPGGFDLVIDGLFGAGLARPVEGVVAAAIKRANAGSAPILAIDLPSGVDADTGAVLGTAIRASATATFVCRKPAHLLLPGRELCGAVHVGDIGIGEPIVASVAGPLHANGPALFRPALRLPGVGGHKYDRGHAVVFSGPAARTGAARLCATAALRAGAGLVTMFSPPGAILVNAAHLTAVMLRRCADETDLVEHLADARLNAFAIGPGFGAGERARAYVRRLLEARRHVVLDADALTAFANDPATLFSAIAAGEGQAVLTPHAGEFKRLFPAIAAAGGSKVAMARAAAEAAGAVVVLKGADTVIADPGGRAAINATGTPWLATAGTGDVLAGIVLAQLAQGVPAFEAAAAAVWMHGRAAEHFGPGLIAEDLPGLLPGVFAELVA